MSDTTRQLRGLHTETLRALLLPMNPYRLKEEARAAVEQVLAEREAAEMKETAR